MRKNRKNISNIGRIIKIVLLILVASLLIKGLLARVIQDYKRYLSLKREFAELYNREKELRKQLTELQRKEKEEVQQDVLEKEVRLKLGMKKKGEKVVMIVPPTIATTSTSIFPTSGEQEKKDGYGVLSYFRELWYDFIGNFKTLGKNILKKRD